MILIKHFQKSSPRQPIEKLLNSNITAIFFVIFYPVLMFVFTGFLLTSFLIPIYQLAVFLLCLVVYFFFFIWRFQIFSIVESVRSAIKVLFQSISLLPILLPLLLIIVLLSVFSEELWFISGNLDRTRILLVIGLLILPAFFIILARFNTILHPILTSVLEKIKILDMAKTYSAFKTTFR